MLAFPVQLQIFPSLRILLKEASLCWKKILLDCIMKKGIFFHNSRIFVYSLFFPSSTYEILRTSFFIQIEKIHLYLPCFLSLRCSIEHVCSLYCIYLNATTALVIWEIATSFCLKFDFPIFYFPSKKRSQIGKIAWKILNVDELFIELL